MSELLTSGSEDNHFDPLQRLWMLSAQVRDGHDVSNRLRAVSLEDLTAIERQIAFVVCRHLDVAGRLGNGTDVDEQEFPALLSLWDEVIAELRTEGAKLTPRSHAFHMRLASKYADYYRSFEQKLVDEFIQAARAKSDFLGAVAVARSGEILKAARMAEAISRYWRGNLPARLPGLYNIERTAATWALTGGDALLAQNLAHLAAEAGNPLKAEYEDDAPSLAIPPRKLEITVRFGFSASVVPLQLYA
ncbi:MULTISPECIES: hypothetical protein [unclassified Rhizobium]|uniref:hypothetical protein n=1 Tax=unclassified Rhizobium TaxID=2613769 RepID=UPI0007124DA6|nr:MULTISPECIES: hypothetical protein [unclassified Rhizobium]KQV39335.1 hypothetical protein ASC86_22615 [Rhizobium sp. Root1212]KRD35340.1 hypothetical protein ASE37_21185 [Rhizobium sp. Root268]